MPQQKLDEHSKER